MYTTLESLFTAIADAIRFKKEEAITTQYCPQDFPSIIHDSVPWINNVVDVYGSSYPSTSTLEIPLDNDYYYMVISVGTSSTVNAGRIITYSDETGLKYSGGTNVNDGNTYINTTAQIGTPQENTMWVHPQYNNLTNGITLVLKCSKGGF